MKTNIIILFLLGLGINAGAQQDYLSREAYRDKVASYSQVLKQQRLNTLASTEARKIAMTGFLYLPSFGNSGAAAIHRWSAECTKEYG